MPNLYIGKKLIIKPDDQLEKVELTQAEYDALEIKDPNKLYFILDAKNPLDDINKNLTELENKIENSVKVDGLTLIKDDDGVIKANLAMGHPAANSFTETTVGHPVAGTFTVVDDKIYCATQNYVYDGTRELNSNATNLVEEKALYKHLSEYKIKDTDGRTLYKTGAGVIGVRYWNDWWGQSRNESLSVTETPVIAELVSEDNYLKVKTQVFLYNGERPVSNKSKSVVTEQGLYKYVEELDTTKENVSQLNITKADVEDLSNVLADEVIDPPLLDEINNLTREELKKDLFDELWLTAVKEFGSIDHTHEEDGVSKPYYLNELWLTYKEALRIYNAYHKGGSQVEAGRLTGKTNIPFRTSWMSDISRYAEMNPYIEIANLPMTVPGTNTVGAFYGCTNLRKVYGIRHLYGILQEQMFAKCPNLEYVGISKVKSNLCIPDSPKLSVESLEFIVTNSDNNTTAITITVHPDVYNKLTGGEQDQWTEVLNAAAARNISFATTT